MIMENVSNILSEPEENNVFYRNNLIDGSQPFYCRRNRQKGENFEE